MTWDRETQTYWIYRGRGKDRGKNRVVSIKTGSSVCDFPSSQLYDNDFVKAVCFASDDEALFELLGITGETDDD